MKVVFFETTNATPHLETSLELAKLHLEKGDEVHFHFLGHAVRFSEFVREIAFGMPRCMPERKAVKMLDHSRFHYFEPKFDDSVKRIKLPNFISISELRSYSYKNYSAGVSTLSSLASLTKNSCPDLVENKSLLNDILLSGVQVYEYTRKILEDVKPDLIYLFNGRFANNRAILDAAKEAKIDFLIHERGSNKTKYSLRAFMPHDFEKIRQEMALSWERAIPPPSQRKLKAKEFLKAGAIGLSKTGKASLVIKR
jgi:hypothetical protein